RPELAADESFVQRFEAESNHVASIEHSNVIPIYAVGDAGGLVYLAMRFVDRDLSDAIKLAGRLDPPRAVGIVYQLCAALDAAPAAGLVHRDVKPGNVLLTDEGGRELALLTDFGLAKSVASTVVDGLFEGTFDYAAPEQIRGHPIDGRTDVYSAG